MMDRFQAAALATAVGLGLLFGCETPPEKAPVGTAGKVTCYEDEIAIPRAWVPGTPKGGVTWDCVNTEEWIAEITGPI